MALRLYNTRTRTKEDFVPLDPSHIRMYVCGPTVYDHAHIGNARPIIVFDVLYRLLRHLAANGEWDGGKGATRVTYARNITDVEDKINDRAAELYPELAPEARIRKLTEETTAQFHADIRALGVLMPEDVNKPGEQPSFIEPRATGHIAEMKAIIEALIAKGFAYVAEDHVLFHVAAMPDYGQLARRSLDEMRAGARVEVAPYKRDPMDFVLWKPSREGEPAWPSPGGISAPGRPGWHLECSAMADKWLWQEAKATLGAAGLAHPHQFDIHGGGIDLVFPHHENEVAQSRCAHGTPIMANVWMHNGFLQVEGQKMSKSLGNFVTINQLLLRWPGEIVRLSMLMTHYREPINWTAARLRETWEEFSDWILELDDVLSDLLVNEYHEPDTHVLNALYNDLNTPAAIARIRAIYKEAARGEVNAANNLGKTLAWLGVYRPSYHQSYLYNEEEGEAILLGYLAKYRETIEVARAIVLNEYNMDSDIDIRKESLARVKFKINALDARMLEDQVCLLLSEHGSVELTSTGHLNRPDNLQDLIAKRSIARKAKNFAEADRIRDELAAMGIALKDAKNPETGEIETTWEIAR